MNLLSIFYLQIDLKIHQRNQSMEDGMTFVHGFEWDFGVSQLPYLFIFSLKLFD